MLKMYKNLRFYEKVIICNFSKYPKIVIIGPEYSNYELTWIKIFSFNPFIKSWKAYILQ